MSASPQEQFISLLEHGQPEQAVRTLIACGTDIEEVGDKLAWKFFEAIKENDLGTALGILAYCEHTKAVAAEAVAAQLEIPAITFNLENHTRSVAYGQMLPLMRGTYEEPIYTIAQARDANRRNLHANVTHLPSTNAINVLLTNKAEELQQSIPNLRTVLLWIMRNSYRNLLGEYPQLIEKLMKQYSPVHVAAPTAPT